MKKFMFNLSIILLLAVTSFAQSPGIKPDAIVGIYWSPNKETKIEIYKKGEHYYGKSIWVATPRKDSKNPNVNLKKRAILGIVLLSEFSYTDGDHLSGKMYDPESGNTVDCKMVLTGSTLKIKEIKSFSFWPKRNV